MGSEMCIRDRPKAYPVYNDGYEAALDTVKEFLGARLPNLYLVGRNGMHRYNNQDHSMLTAMLAVENIQGRNHNLWEVNAEKQYHEEITEEEASKQDLINTLNKTQPMVPRSLRLKDGTNVPGLAFAILDKLSLALAVGLVSAVIMFLLTLALSMSPAFELREKVSLFGQFFYGYQVSKAGAFIGFLYGFFWGFLFGWVFAYLRNLLFIVMWRKSVSKRRLSINKRILDFV